MKTFLVFLSILFSSCQEAKNKSSVALSQDPTDTMKMDNGLPWEKYFGINDFNRKFINKELLLYLKEKHSNWSIPNQFQWYPQLFARYKTDSSLVSYISGDFDCNGQKDYALIVEKENGVPAVVSFLRMDSTFKTVELGNISKTMTPTVSTDISQRDKYEVMLTLYKPGRYDIIDPDLGPSNPTFVKLKCNAVGITPFRELYEEGSEVIYWENNKLRSCIIKN
jgi:hypothetical protein